MTTQLTLKKLTDDGFQVKITHFRFPAGKLKKSRKSRNKLIPRIEFAKNHSMESVNINSCGGKTDVEITTPQGTTVSGTSECSYKDHFNRRLGVSIALGRAVAKLNNVQ